MIASGYSVKIIKDKDEWLKSTIVKKIYSVSECISECPIKHYKEWKFNKFYFYDNEQIILDLIQNQRIKHNLIWFFYETFENELLNGKWNMINKNSHNISRQEDYIFRGYDVVCYSTGQSHECSPLSCNHGYERFDVNQYCLIDSFDYAKKVTEEIDKNGKYEPGPYRLLSVYERI